MADYYQHKTKLEVIKLGDIGVTEKVIKLKKPMKAPTFPATPTTTPAPAPVTVPVTPERELVPVRR